MAKGSCVPVIDLDPFFKEGNEDQKEKAIKEIIEAASDYGFFKVSNHGVPSNHISQALDLLSKFFACPADEKLNCISTGGSVFPVGYLTPPLNSVEYFEHYMMVSPTLGSNVYPENVAGFRQAMDEIFPELNKVTLLIESILSVSMGLPPGFLKQYSGDEAYDLLVGLHYPAATETSKIGKISHEDSSSLTLLLQGQVGGLEIEKDGEWVQVSPDKGTLVVNVGDVIQVLSNKKFKSATHRVVSPEGQSRYSIAFARMLPAEKWVEPLPKFTSEVGNTPKYRGFVYQDYMQLRIRNRKDPHTKQEDYFNINHYAIDV